METTGFYLFVIQEFDKPEDVFTVGCTKMNYYSFSAYNNYGLDIILFVKIPNKLVFHHIINELHNELDNIPNFGMKYFKSNNYEITETVINIINKINVNINIKHDLVGINREIKRNKHPNRYRKVCNIITCKI